MNHLSKISIFVLIVVFLIWGQSFFRQNDSNVESLWIKEHIADPITAFFGVESLPHSVIRKIAHCIEFAILGIGLSFLFKRKVVRTFYAGFTVAFLDETIQGFAGRSSELSDVWIDLIGIVVGIIMKNCLIGLMIKIDKNQYVRSKK